MQLILETIYNLKIIFFILHSLSSCTSLLNLLSWTFGPFLAKTAGLSICSIVSPLSYPLPITIFSFILNFKQLSSLNLPTCFLAWFFVVINGESHYIAWLFCLSITIDGGLYLIPVPWVVGEPKLYWTTLWPKNSCFKASAAEILFDGSFYNNLLNKSKASLKNKFTFWRKCLVIWCLEVEFARSILTENFIILSSWERRFSQQK